MKFELMKSISKNKMPFLSALCINSVFFGCEYEVKQNILSKTTFNYTKRWDSWSVV